MNTEREKTPNPEVYVKPSHGPAGLYGKLRDAGVLDQVAEAIRRGDTLQQVADFCTSLGFQAGPTHIYRIRQRIKVEWEEARFKQAALDAHVDGVADDGTALEVLIDRMMVAKFAGMMEDAEGPDALATVMPLWTAWKRMRTAEKAEARAERSEELKARELSRQVAARFLDVINSEDMAAKARAIRDGVIESGGGIEKQVEAIQSFLWGDVFQKEAA